MTKSRLNAVGYCARMTRVGDWAFRFALDLARRHDAKLDIFFFPTSPCEEHEPRGRRGGPAPISEEDRIAIEREVRLYYDERLEDYLEVGFRLCLGDEAPELRRCLLDREYDVLVLAYERRLCPFGQRPIEEFSERMQCPVVLVGPGARDEMHLNKPAELWTTELRLNGTPWRPVGQRAAATRLTDLMSPEEWYEFDEEMNERTGLNACTYDAEGAKVTAYRKWANHLCPVIKADPKSSLAICGVPHEVFATQARREQKTVIDECEAGMVKICVPVIVDGEFLGLVGGCGMLLEGSEVETEIVELATGLSREAVTNLKKDIRRLSMEEAEALARYVETRVKKIVDRA